ncbi:MAG: hypothetical protein ACREBU_05620 [Nitrososphaera sp.]
MGNRFLCGTPRVNCSGGNSILSSGLKDCGFKIHVTSFEAFKCFARYQERTLGFEKVAPREFRTSEGILILSKKSKFGGKLKSGKNDAKIKGKRFMPAFRHGGLIIG